MPQNDPNAKSMWATSDELDNQQAAAMAPSSMRAQTLGERIRNWWDRPAGMGSLSQKPNANGSYGPSQGDVVKGVGEEAANLLTPMAMESATAAKIATKLPQRVKAAASGATEGYSVGSGLEKMGLPYGGRLGAIGGGLYGAVTGNDPLMQTLTKAGEAWRGRGGVTPPTPEAPLAQRVMQGGSSTAGTPATGMAEAKGPQGNLQIGNPPKPGIQDQVTQQVAKEQALRDARIAAGINPTAEPNVNIAGYQKAKPPKAPTTSSSGVGATITSRGSSPTASASSIEDAYRRAGLYTPYSSAQETGTWHAGQGAVPSPYETDIQSLVSKVRSASPARPSTFKGIEIPSEAPAPRPTLADRMRVGEVMQQGTAASSRATPTSELAPSLWEGVEQPVVDLPNEPSRAGLEYQMGEGQPDEASAIREAQRAKLEKADPNRYKK